MYQPMPVLHCHSVWPLSASNDLTSPMSAVTTSVFPPGPANTAGACHDSFTPPALHFSAPVAWSRATSDSLSTLALTSTSFLYNTGEAAEPQPLSSEPTFEFQFCL